MNYTAIAVRMSDSELISAYEVCTGKIIKKFETRAVGVRRVAKIMAEEKLNIAMLKEFCSKQTMGLISQLPADRKGKFPGPAWSLQGKIYKLVKKNPRREDTFGWHSFNLVTNGMTTEEYREAGGRRVDLLWDVKHGNLEVKDR